MSDPIADMLTIIRNGQAVKKKTVVFGFSKIKLTLVEALKNEGFVSKVTQTGRSAIDKKIEVTLKYDEKGNPAISELKRVSKVGQRVYRKYSEFRMIRQGYGRAIVSTSKGIMTSKEAKKQKLGGEVIFEVF